MPQSCRLTSMKWPRRSTCAMPDAASSKVCRHRAPPRGERDAARLLGEDGERTQPRAPRLFATDAVAPRLDAEIAPAVPVLRPADVAHHGAQGGANIGLLSKVPRDGVLERDQPRFAPLLRDVAPDAAVAKELARRPEHPVAPDRPEG